MVHRPRKVSHPIEETRADTRNVTLRFRAVPANGCQRERRTAALLRTRGAVGAVVDLPVRTVTSFHRATSPASGAVLPGGSGLTCSAISIPGKQGGEKRMSLASVPNLAC
ncbi:hypothetical protein GCM10027521_26150 [Amycolatopsis cihanbeyliensis]